MAEIKSYTDLEQSQALAKILPHESADMSWKYQKDKWVGEPDYREWPEFEKATDKRDIPCWSLAALINLLPQHIVTGMGYLQLVIDKNWDGKTCEVAYENGDSYKECRNENLVDSCVEMISRLHEMGYKKWPRK